MRRNLDFDRYTKMLFRWAAIYRESAPYCADSLERAAHEVQAANRYRRNAAKPPKPSMIERLFTPLMRLFVTGGR